MHSVDYSGKNKLLFLERIDTSYRFKGKDINLKYENLESWIGYNWKWVSSYLKVPNSGSQQAQPWLLSRLCFSRLNLRLPLFFFSRSLFYFSRLSWILDPSFQDPRFRFYRLFIGLRDNIRKNTNSFQF